MPNHYHLLVESTHGRLSDAMGFVGSQYTQWFNATNPGYDGPLFRGRFHSVRVCLQEHWRYLPLYIHLNPVRANLVTSLSQSRWTSHGAYAGTDPRPDWLTLNDLGGGVGHRGSYMQAIEDVTLGREGPPSDFGQVLFAPGGSRSANPRPRRNRRPAAQRRLSRC